MKLILNLAQSLDGYIAKKNGNFEFLNLYPAPDYDFEKFVKSISTIIMGNNTYKQMKKYGEFPFKNKRVYVYSKSVKGNDGLVQYTKLKPSALLKKVKGNVWLFGGQKIIKLFSNYIDEFQIATVPHLIGSGIPLFENMKEQQLKLTSSKSFKSGLTINIYKRT